MDIIFPFFGAALLLGLAFIVFDIVMLVDAVQRPAEHFNPPESRTWWIVGLAVGLALGLVGFAIAIVYYFLVRKPAVEGKVAPPISCPSCGTRQTADARFCKACGTALTREPAP